MREVPLQRVAPDSPKQTGPRGSVFLHPPFYTARGVVSRDPSLLVFQSSSLLVFQSSSLLVF